MEARFEIIEDGSEFRWILVHTNGTRLAESYRTYGSRSKVKRAIDSVKRVTGDADVVDTTVALANTGLFF